mmetsp:Transcript_17296/g.45103  ORF Transcript_17296/g.45103 Transcript_17296/m.45103 type:complete len:323 (-) Transcript_17296:888-1856(-)
MRCRESELETWPRARPSPQPPPFSSSMTVLTHFPPALLRASMELLFGSESSASQSRFSSPHPAATPPSPCWSQTTSVSFSPAAKIALSISWDPPENLSSFPGENRRLAPESIATPTRSGHTPSRFADLLNSAIHAVHAVMYLAKSPPESCCGSSFEQIKVMLRVYGLGWPSVARCRPHCVACGSPYMYSSRPAMSSAKLRHSTGWIPASSANCTNSNMPKPQLVVGIQPESVGGRDHGGPTMKWNRKPGALVMDPPSRITAGRCPRKSSARSLRMCRPLYRPHSPGSSISLSTSTALDAAMPSFGAGGVLTRTNPIEAAAAP